MTHVRDYRSALEEAFTEALDYLEGLPSAGAAASLSAEAFAARFAPELPLQGAPASEVIAALRGEMRPGLMRTSGGRSFAWVIGGTLPGALAADWMTSAWDQNAVLNAVSPAAAVVEAVTGRWLTLLLGLPANATFSFVTGCQMAHFTCLSAARHRLLANAGWDVERRGLWGAPPLRVIDAGQRHASVDRALRFLWLGTDALRSREAGARWDPEALRTGLEEEPEQPTIVLLQAGDIHTGESDCFGELIPIARAHGAGVHVDGAFGLWARASDAQRHLVAGVEDADSWAVDGHKWLNVPFDSGYAVVADGEAHRRSMSADAEYVATSTSLREPVDYTPEWSRRARAIATHAVIRELGREGIARQVEESCRLTRRLVGEMGRLPRVDVVRPPLLNQGLLRVRSARSGATSADHDHTTRRVAESMARQGDVFVQPSRWANESVIRISVCSWMTTDYDVDRAVEALRRALDGE